MKVRLLAAMTAAALGLQAVPQPGLAMNLHVNGRQIVLSGDVTTTDGYLFADTLARLRASGHPVDTVVLRNSPGGSTFSGYGIADIIRREGLATVASGYCISSCSIMLAGGTKRAFAAGDQPFMLTDTTDDSGQFIGVHGVTAGGAYSAFYSSELRDYFIQALYGDDPAEADDPLLADALSNHGASYARLWDPATGRQPSVYWCNPDCGNPSQYKAYPGDDAHRSGFITEAASVRTTDTLTIDHDVVGDVNPNYFNPDKPGTVDPITPLGALLANDGVSYYGDGSAFRAGSRIDAFLQGYAEETPRERAADLSSIFIDDSVKRVGVSTTLALLGDPTSELSKTLKIIEAGADKPLIDRSTLSVDDAYGVLHVTHDATWTLPAGTYASGDTLIVDHGRLRLDGGEVNLLYSYVGVEGRVDGHGAIGEVYSRNTASPQLTFSHGAVLHPTGDGITMAGYVDPDQGSTAAIALRDATLALDVRPDQAHAPLRFESVIVPVNAHEYTGHYHYYYGGRLNVASQSVLALNMAPGFYATGRSLPLVAPDIDGWLTWLQRTSPEDFLSLAAGTIASYRKTLSTGGGYVSAPFKRVARADGNGDTLGAYAIDPTAGEAFQPFDYSLGSYNILQNGSMIWLQANDAFRGQRAFCGLAGCGLGDALSHASRRDDTPLAPLLGALQFSTTAQAARAAGQLRGDGYANLRTASLSLLGNFGSALKQHLRAADPSTEQHGSMAFAGSAGAGGLGLQSGPHAGDLSAMLSGLEQDQDAEEARDATPDDTSMWGRLFGHRGTLDRQDDVAGLDQRSVGGLIGVDHRIDDGTVVGAVAGFGKLRADDDDRFHGRVRAVDARAYVDRRYEKGYLTASLGYTHLHSDADRRIELPLYTAKAHAGDGGNAFSLNLEHGWTLRDRHDVIWQPILPALDFTRLPGQHFADRGAGAAGLAVDGKPVTDVRVGAGVQVQKSFAWGQDGAVIPHARLLLQHRFSAHENRLTASLQGNLQDTFAVVGAHDGLNHAQLDVGLDARRDRRLGFTADYLGDFAKRHRDQGVMLGMRYRW